MIIAPTIIDSEQAKKTFLTADFHFEHFNIIRYCHRPFRNTEEMNRTLIKNCNETVGTDDIVYFLGDFGYGRYYRDPLYWLRQLNGYWVLIEGSHDKLIPKCLMRPYEFVTVNGTKLLLIHNYQDAYRLELVPRDWSGWIIHGHNHQKRPFIMFNRNRVNVSVEVTGYKPINLAWLVELIKNGERK
jgi:calcineurin-like phosphoesterase family protein